MTTQRDPETVLAAWLDEGPTDLPDATRRAILTALPTTSQARRGLFAPWRFSQMNTYTRLATTAIVAVIAIGGALYLFGSNRGVGSGGPTPSPTISPPPTAAPSPVAAASPSFGPIDTTTWTTYTSTRYGFTIGHPADWTERPADHSWTLPAAAPSGAPDAMGTSAEGFIAPGQTILVSAWSVAVAPGTSAQTWMVDVYCPSNQVPSASDPAPCDRLGPGGPRVTVVMLDGHAGVLARFTDDTQAFVLVGNRMYIVACWRPEDEPTVGPYGGATRLLEAFVSTMHLLPGGPAPSATPRGT